MQHHRTSLFAGFSLAPLVLVLAPQPAGHSSSEMQLRCHVEEGALLQRTYRGGLALEYEGMTSSMNGQEVPQQYLPEIELDVTHTFEAELEDHVLAVEDGEPRVFERRYEKIRAQDGRRFTMGGPFVEPENTENSWESESMLEGRAVRFRWDEDEEAHERELVEEGPELLLKGLDWDLDWRTLLPEDGDVTVEVGARWDCAKGAGLALLRPAGKLHWSVREYADPRDLLKPIEEVRGTLEARIVEVDEEKGICIIEIEGELENEDVRETDLSHIPVTDGDATETTTTEYELEGRLVWDLAGHHPRSLKAEAEVSLASVTEKLEGQPGGGFSSTMRLTGKWHLEMELERSEGDG